MVESSAFLDDGIDIVVESSQSLDFAFTVGASFSIGVHIGSGSEEVSTVAVV